jgi:hypothetical protein
MVALSADQRSTPVMVYTSNALVRGEVVTMQSVRVSTWLRTQGVPEYIHLFNPSVIHFGSGAIQSLTYAEMYVPVSAVIAFHLASPKADPVDYASDEKKPHHGPDHQRGRYLSI